MQTSFLLNIFFAQIDCSVKDDVVIRFLLVRNVFRRENCWIYNRAFSGYASAEEKTKFFFRLSTWPYGSSIQKTNKKNQKI